MSYRAIYRPSPDYDQCFKGTISREFYVNLASIAEQRAKQFARDKKFCLLMLEEIA